MDNCDWHCRCSEAQNSTALMTTLLALAALCWLGQWIDTGPFCIVLGLTLYQWLVKLPGACNEDRRTHAD